MQDTDDYFREKFRPQGTGNQENNIAIPAVPYNETAPGLLDKPKRSKIILHSECSMVPIQLLY